jgi:hypothetical protein
MDNNVVGGPKWWELVAQVGMAQLHHPFRAGQIAQPVGAQIGQPHPGREPVDHQRLGRTRQHRLPAMGQITQPRAPVDGRTRVAAIIAQLHLAGMHRDAQPDRGQRCPLQLQRARHRVGGAGERGHETVALALLHWAHPAMGGDDIGHDVLEACDRGGHLIGLGLPQPRRALDVCQKQRHRSRQQKPAHAQLAQSTSGVSARGSICLMLASIRRPRTPNHQRKRV